MNKIYWTYRVSYYNKWEGKYYPSFRLEQQYADYKEAWLTNIIDQLVPEERYTSEIAPWIKKQTRFIIGEYNATYVNVDDYKANVANVWAEFQIEIFNTSAEAIAWIKANTDLVEDSNVAGKFLITEASTDAWVESPAKYLIID